MHEEEARKTVEHFETVLENRSLIVSLLRNYFAKRVLRRRPGHGPFSDNIL